MKEYFLNIIILLLLLWCTWAAWFKGTGISWKKQIIVILCFIASCFIISQIKG